MFAEQREQIDMYVRTCVYVYACIRMISMQHSRAMACYTMSGVISCDLVRSRAISCDLLLDDVGGDGDGDDDDDDNDDDDDDDEDSQPKTNLKHTKGSPQAQQKPTETTSPPTSQ